MYKTVTNITCLLFLFSCSGVPSSESERVVQVDAYALRIPQRDTIVDHVLLPRQPGATPHIMILARDVDGLAKSYWIKYKSPHNQSRSQPVFHGYETKLPHMELLDELSSKREILIRYAKSSCLQGPSYFSLVTLELDEILPVPHYNLYIIRKIQSRYRRIYLLKNASSNLHHFIFRDLNDDCLPEMIDISKPAGTAFANVRTVTDDDKTLLLQEVAGRSILANEFYVGDVTLRVVGFGEKPTQRLRWNKKSSRFEEDLPTSPDAVVTP